MPAATKFLDGKIASAKPPIKDAAKPLLDDQIAVASAGRAFRKSVPPAKLRAEYAARLRKEFDAGSETAPVQTATAATASDLAAAELVRRASRMFPAKLVKEAGPIAVEATPKGSTFRGDYTFLTGAAHVDPGKIDNAIHEYVHHLQARVPGFQDVFRAEHIRRTTLEDGKREPIVISKTYKVETRDDDYIDEYFGTHYQASVVKGSDAGLPDPEGLEVPTRGYQILFDSLDGEDMLGDLANDDPGLLDLLLGALFQYPP